MTYIAAAYLLALVYISTRQPRSPAFPSLKTAWIWLALIPLSQFFFTVFRSANIRAPSGLALVEIWANGFGWLFLGLSMFCLTGAFEVQPMPTPPTDGSGNQPPE